MLFREFDIVMWASMNSEPNINKILKMGANKDNNIKNIHLRLLNTAYSLKTRFAEDKVNMAIQAYFSVEHPLFLGKYTQWSLLEDNDSIDIEPLELNKIFMTLKFEIEK